MNCGRVSNQLSAYIDRELTGAEMLQMRRHLGDCDACRAEYEALCRMKMLLGRLQAPAPRPNAAAATVQRFHASGGSFSLTRRSPQGPSWAALPAPFLRMAPGFGRRPRLCRRRSTTPRVAWPLTTGFVTAGLAAALLFTSIIFYRPRHSDALVATSPIPVLQGEDIFESQGASDWNTIGLLDRMAGPGSAWMHSSASSPALRWMTVSLQDEGQPGSR